MPERRDIPLTVTLVADGEPDVVVARMDARHADLALVDALMRWALVARRRRCELRLGDVPEDLRALLAFVGLSEALGLDGAAGVDGLLEPRRQPERGEQLGEDEVVQPRDLPA